MKILVVEDDLVSRLILLKQLAVYGRADVAVNGSEAVQAVQMALQQEEPYQLVFLDIMMPEMNGQEALVRIRGAEHEAGLQGLDRSRIIMTTALGGSGDILNSFRDECDGYLVKPIKVQDIRKLLEVIVS